MFRATAASIVGRISSVNHHHHHNKRGAIVLVVAMENSVKSASSSSDAVSSSRWDSLRTPTSRPTTHGGKGSTTTTSRRHFHGDRQQSQQQSPQQQQQQQQHARNNNNNYVTIINNDFTTFHKLCQATRYRVHAPNCTCHKVGNLYTRPLRLYTNNEEESVRVVAASSLSEAVTTKNENDDDDVCSKLLSRLDLKSTATTSTTIATTTMPDILNNLIVLPDTQSLNPKYIYVCTDTHSQAFQSNWKQCEDKLAKEIFNSSSSSSSSSSISSSSSSNLPSFKVSCAICLLQYQSNGFAAILSPTIANILPTITAAKQNAQCLLNSATTTNKKVLHADHAHFLCAIELSVLQQLVAVVSKSTSTNDNRMA
jgi:hypothetical protein